MKKPNSFPKVSHIIWIMLIFISVRATYYFFSDGFSIVKIENTFPNEPEWQLPAPSGKAQKTIATICDQPFYYLGKGSQAYAFLSEDKKYVLKLFKCYHLSPVTWLEKLPLPDSLSSWKNDTIYKRQKKIDDTLKSYKLAATSLVDECGLIAMEILPTPEFHQSVSIIDKLGRSRTINLGNYGFIIQKRADLVYTSLSSWIDKGEIENAKTALSSLVRLIVKRSKKGIQDSDPDLHKNAGLIGTSAIFIDLGSFHANPEAKRSETYIKDLQKITNNLRMWLEKQSPELARHLENEIQNA